ncbi:hypothetical protein [uncultured Fibrella sp.]|uniref:hypothetical protein n=1 Tax=uncultured Fibrella sp. TaxID=1284596 RepID=UPI0035C95AA7
MFTKLETRFIGETPTIGVVLEKLRTAVGFDQLIIKETDPNDVEITNPLDEADMCDVYCEGSSYFVICWYDDYNYMVAACMYTLRSLGGDHRGWLPEWSSLSWEEAKPLLNYPLT